MKVATIILSVMLFGPGLSAQAKEKLEEVVIKTKKGKVFQKYHKKNGKMHGDFEEYWKLDHLTEDYLKIKGQFIDGKKTGTWTDWPMWNVPDKKREFEYVDDKLCGKHTSYGDSGEVEWKGQYKDDKQTGEWTRYWPNGELREQGQMVENLREGRWKAECDSGWGEGLYAKGKKQAIWQCYTMDWKMLIAEGKYVDDLREGLWVKYGEGKKKVAEETFAAGKLNGPFCEWYSNGEKKQEGAVGTSGLEGTYTSWHENGQKRERMNYKAGKPVGFCESWWEDGKKQSETDHDKGTLVYWNKEGQKTDEDTGGPDGSRIRYYPGGSKSLERKRKKNIVVLETEYHENGQKKAEGATHEKDRSKRDGKWKFWYDTGDKEAEGEMCLYGRIGKWVEFHKNGKKKSEGQWFSAFDKLTGKVIEIQILKWTWWDEEGKETKTENFPDPRKEKLPGK